VGVLFAAIRELKGAGCDAVPFPVPGLIAGRLHGQELVEGSEPDGELIPPVPVLQRVLVRGMGFEALS
jgi:hypothetical protein